MKASIGKAAKAFRVHPETLRRWEKAGKIEAERTPTGRRMYDLTKLRGLVSHEAPSSRLTPAYASVSSPDQKEDLVRHVALPESLCAANGWTFETLQDRGSGLNDRKPGLRTLIRRICSGEIGRLVITPKHRLLRSGSDLGFSLCGHFWHRRRDHPYVGSGCLGRGTGFGCAGDQHRVFGPTVRESEPSDPRGAQRLTKCRPGGDRRMQRTAQYESRPLNREQRRQLLALVNACCRVKSLALTILGRTQAWDYLDTPNAFRDAMKSRYIPGVPVHLQDQAAFDAVATMGRYLESGARPVFMPKRVFWTDLPKRRNATPVGC